MPGLQSLCSVDLCAAGHRHRVLWCPPDRPSKQMEDAPRDVGLRDSLGWRQPWGPDAASSSRPRALALVVLSHSERVLHTQTMCQPLTASIPGHDVSHSSLKQTRRGSPTARGNGADPSLRGRAPEAPAEDNMFVTDRWAAVQSGAPTLPVISGKLAASCDEAFETQPHLTPRAGRHPSQGPSGCICKSLSPRLIVPNNGPDPSVQKEGWQAHSVCSRNSPFQVSGHSHVCRR